MGVLSQMLIKLSAAAFTKKKILILITAWDRRWHPNKVLFIDLFLTEMSLFIWNLNFTGDPVFHLATLPGAFYFTRK